MVVIEILAAHAGQNSRTRDAGIAERRIDCPVRYEPEKAKPCGEFRSFPYGQRRRVLVLVLRRAMT